MSPNLSAIFLCEFLLLSCSLFGSDWATSTLQRMTLEEKIGQLFIAPARPVMGAQHAQNLKHLIQTRHIGGLIWMQGTRDAQRIWSEEMQKTSDIPLLCTMDAEWGSGMRLSDAVSFPKNLALGAIQDETLLEELGQEMGQECKSLGIHINFAPVVDVNTEPLNPVIGLRSFGSHPFEVARRALIVAKAMEKEGVLACAKHFPGHGDVIVDSHFGLPTIRKSLGEMQNNELYPFYQMAHAGISSIMIGHLHIPAVDNLPASLSSKWVHDLLQTEWGYEGLIVTDSLCMQALTLQYATEEIAQLSVLAGAHLLVYSTHVPDLVDDLIKTTIPKAIDGLIQACREGVIEEKEIDARVLRLLQTKEKLLLHQTCALPPARSLEKGEALKKKLFQNALSWSQGTRSHAPLVADTIVRSIACNGTGQLQSLIDSGTSVEPEHVVVAIYGKGEIPSANAFSSPVTYVLFDNPYFHLDLLSSSANVLIAFQKDPVAEEIAADILFGRLQATGRTPF